MVKSKGSTALQRGADTTWPSNCAEAHALVFRLRREGLPLLPGLDSDKWAQSILAWAGHPKKCRGVVEVAA